MTAHLGRAGAQCIGMLFVHLSRSRLVAALVALLIGIPALALAALWVTLPSVDDLYRRVQAPSTRILDRHGRLLYEIIDPRAGHHAPLPLDRIPVRLRQATIAVEDANFYTNPGVDLAGIVRALWINVQGGEVLAGGSTITQQLARMMLLEPEERAQRTLLRKLRESLLAWQIAQRYSKDEVLALYLNQSYYGNLAYGVEAAARAYFGKPAGALDLAECALLAGLIQAPALYDPFNAPERAKQRQGVVLDLMVRQGYLTAAEAAEARQARLSYAPSAFAIRAPHFVSYVRLWLETQFGPEMLVRGGLVVTTTLDLALNDATTAIVRARLAQLQQPAGGLPAHNARNAAVVALDPQSGAIRVMVGSPNYFDAGISGAVNAALALRQPGSAIKPVTYAAAFQSVPGFTAATPILDVRTAFPTREGTPYLPENYDRRFHGPISARDALATSNNVAAVRVLQQVGLDAMIGLANALGIHSFRSADAYGLSLTLGGGEVRLLELAAAYAALAHKGRRVDPFAVSAVTDAGGRVLYVRPTDQLPAPQPQILDPRVAWLVTDILADNAARAAAFGQNSVLKLSRPAAVKTGTTTDWRDNWTVGYTPDLVVGAWVGNADGQPMRRVSGVTGAGPIWADVMEMAHRGQPTRWFERPAGLTRVEVCALSGLLPSPDCPHTRWEWFVEGTQPTIADTWHVRERIDRATGQLADAGTPPERVMTRLAFRLPAEARDWARAQGWPLALEPTPERSVAQAGVSCNAGAACAPLMLVQPDAGAIFRVSRQLPRSVQRIALEVHVDADQIPLSGVARVEVILDDPAGRRVIAAMSALPYRAFWTLEPGAHRLFARAHLAGGAHVDSLPVQIQVLE